MFQSGTNAYLVLQQNGSFADIPKRCLEHAKNGETVKVSEAGLGLIILEGLLEDAKKSVRRKKKDYNDAKERLDEANQAHDKLVDQINNLKQYIGRM